jgi:hypothetical protein
MGRRLSDFLGQWRLEKDIRQADGGSARFEGTATWDADGLYQETGLLRLASGDQMRAERRYLWRAPLAVYFEDGRFFHEVPPEGGEAYHHCAPDDYRVHYDFSDWPRWIAVWQVAGPRKGYEMSCLYVPHCD